MCFLSIKKYSKILRIKIKSVYVTDFLISTKVRLKKVEHLYSKGFFSCELYFSIPSSMELLLSTVAHAKYANVKRKTKYFLTFLQNRIQFTVELTGNQSFNFLTALCKQKVLQTTFWYCLASSSQKKVHKVHMDIPKYY